MFLIVFYLIAAVVIAFIMNLAFSAPSWCQDCKQASRDEWEAGMMGYNSASYSCFCKRHGRMWFRGLDPRPLDTDPR